MMEPLATSTSPIPDGVPTHVVIASHPRQRSFTLSMAEGYAEVVRQNGGRVIFRDLYRIGFNPLLHAREMPDHEGFQPRPDVVVERQLIGKADVYAFFYPLWFNSPPAMIKGYVERVFGMGFAYSPHGLSGNRPLLADRAMVTFTSTGAPQDWVEHSGAWDAMRAHFDDHFSAVTGLRNLGHHNFGRVRAGMGEAAMRERLQELQLMAATVMQGGVIPEGTGTS
ncbi:NAD(P)H-dependent oxidoreductase [Brevundimonas sp.]|uniref:NAD(P)H-dependent oxidoreductase n=1 Tax=Brevundimonas sp. TaxID=1871086 RepID=UPI00343A3D46